jgi:Domain of unknown function DUF11
VDDFEDTILSHAFSDLRHEVAPQVRPAGIAAAQQSVRHRRRVRVTVIAVIIGLLALLVPAGAFAALGAGPEHAPKVGSSTHPSPHDSSPPPSPSPSASSATPPPDGHITYNQLKNATITVPAWPSDAAVTGCLSGKITFSDGMKNFHQADLLYFGTPVYADVDGDGAEETMVLLTCGHDWVDTGQVLALDRDAAGAIVTIGPVAVQTGSIRRVCGVRPGADGSVDVQVADFLIQAGTQCTAQDAPYAILQWRTYRLVGDAFQQTGGETSFPVNHKVGDLTVSASNLIFTAASANSPNQTGSMTVTVHNAGPGAPPSTITVELPMFTNVSTPANCTKSDYPDRTYVTCPVASVAADGKKTLTLTLSIDSPTTVYVTPTVSVMAGEGCADPDNSNDTTHFNIIYR